MGCVAVVALGKASVDRQALFGHNTVSSNRGNLTLYLTPGRCFTFGEKIRLRNVELPQVRQTATVLGGRGSQGWGYDCGINEHRVGIGLVGHRTALSDVARGLNGCDLVRVALEQARSARHAVDLLGQWIERHGQSANGNGDSAFLIADPEEAYALEAAGPFWVCQEICEVRAVSGASVIRQDWDAISPGLAAHAIRCGRWQADGSKLDFAGAIGVDDRQRKSALRCWGRASWLLHEQNGNIDLAFIRRIMSDHSAEIATESDELATDACPSICFHGSSPDGERTVGSVVACLNQDPGRPTFAWCALGTPCQNVYFPVFLAGELPMGLEHFGSTCSFQARPHALGRAVDRGDDRMVAAEERLSRLQARIDQETEEFLAEHDLRRPGAFTDLHRQASIFMQHSIEQFEEVFASVMEGGARSSIVS